MASVLIVAKNDEGFAGVYTLSDINKMFKEAYNKYSNGMSKKYFAHQYFISSKRILNGYVKINNNNTLSFEYSGSRIEYVYNLINTAFKRTYKDKRNESDQSLNRDYYIRYIKPLLDNCSPYSRVTAANMRPRLEEYVGSRRYVGDLLQVIVRVACLLNYISAIEYSALFNQIDKHGYTMSGESFG